LTVEDPLDRLGLSKPQAGRRYEGTVWPNPLASGGYVRITQSGSDATVSIHRDVRGGPMVFPWTLTVLDAEPGS
jgi:hypothetical protein